MSDFTTPAQPERVAWNQAVELFSRHELPPPPALPIWPAEVDRFSEHCYGNWKPEIPIYDLAGALREILERGPEQVVLFGFDGHGTSSWGIHFLLKWNSLLIGLQIEAGGAYTDPVQAGQALEGAWGLLAGLIEEVSAAPGAGDRVLVVCDSDFFPGFWGWTTPGNWENSEWHEEPGPLFLARMEWIETVAATREGNA